MLYSYFKLRFDWAVFKMFGWVFRQKKVLAHDVNHRPLLMLFGIHHPIKVKVLFLLLQNYI